VFLQCLDDVDKELRVEAGPWFLSYLSIVDITYISHIERMCASVPYWCGLKLRGNGRWPAIEAWMDAFEQLPSYMATKSDYYTHVKDIPPQYRQAYALPGSEAFRRGIDGLDGIWTLPLPPFSTTDLEPVSAAIDPGEEAARHEAAYKIARNFDKVLTFALRGSGKPGERKFRVELSMHFLKY
jgi:glutathione S-transferase